MSAPGTLLRAAAHLYRGGSALRNRLYDRGLLRAERAPVPVVSIGNLNFGGTGKTPATLWLAAALAHTGERVGVASRGYGGRRTAEPLVAGRAGRALATALEAGDEPTLMATAPGVHVVVVDRRRSVAADLAAAEGATVVLLDDGFQHRQLARDLDIVLVDARWAATGRASGSTDLLREPLSGLGRAGLVLLVDAAAAPERFLEPDELPAALAGPLRRIAVGLRPAVVAAVRRAARLLTPAGVENAPAALAGRRVLAVSGIARPAGFERMLAALGAVVAAHLAFPDHHPYGAQDADLIARRARETGAEFVVTTAKDAVRWPAAAPRPAVLHLALDVAAESAALALVTARLAAAREETR